MSVFQSIPYPEHTAESREKLTGMVNGFTIDNITVHKYQFYDGNIWRDVYPSISDIIQPIIKKTHDELILIKNDSKLTIGQLYQITDHHTKHLIPYSFPNAIHSGTTEPLIVLATSNSTLNKQAYSVLFPNDIIYYDIADTSCEDGIWNVVQQKYLNGTTRTGKITYRKDITHNLETHYDWRNVRFRRWKVDCVDWICGHLYLQHDVVLDPNGNIYVCKALSCSGIISPSIDTVNWELWLDIITSTAFWGQTPNPNYFNVYGITTINLIINNTVPGIDYNDYYTFTLTNELTNSSGIITDNAYGTAGIGHNQIGLECVNSNIIKYSTGISNMTYNNIILGITPNGNDEYFCYSNKFGSNSFNLTFGGNCINTSFDGDAHDLMFIGGQKNNKFKHSINSINFTTATHIYNHDDCEIFTRQDGTTRLRYINNSDVLTVVDPTL